MAALPLPRAFRIMECSTCSFHMVAHNWRVLLYTQEVQQI